jgi:hypothetical protein
MPGKPKMKFSPMSQAGVQQLGGRNYYFASKEGGTMERFEEQLEVIRTAHREHRACRNCLP